MGRLRCAPAVAKICLCLRSLVLFGLLRLKLKSQPSTSLAEPSLRTGAKRRWVAAATKRALAKTDDCQLHTEHCQLRLRRNRSPLGVINRDMLYKDLQSRWVVSWSF